MTQYSPVHLQPVSLTSFTITQYALGSPLFFEPAIGSKDLDDLINRYIPGHASTQQKRAQVVLQFLNCIDASSYLHPVTLHYNVPQSLTLENAMRLPSVSPTTATSPAQSPLSHNANQASSTSKSSTSLKRQRQEDLLPSSAKRLPGFSIMTKDGIDITDLASRGPKTKEQRDHAALMRKLKACAACKRSKQRCDPGHHRLAASPSNSTGSATPSIGSTVSSHHSSARGSRGSISPQSSLGDSFSQSPRRVAIARADPLPSDFSLQGSLLTDLDLTTLPTSDVDPDLFILTDLGLDSWNTPTMGFFDASPHFPWTSYEGLFSSSEGYAQHQPMQGISLSDQELALSLHYFTPESQERFLTFVDDRESATQKRRTLGPASPNMRPDSSVDQMERNQSPFTSDIQEVSLKTMDDHRSATQNHHATGGSSPDLRLNSLVGQAEYDEFSYPPEIPHGSFTQMKKRELAARNRRIIGDSCANLRLDSSMERNKHHTQPTVSQPSDTLPGSVTRSTILPPTRIASRYLVDFPSMATTTPVTNSHSIGLEISDSLSTRDKPAKSKSSIAHLLAIITRILRQDIQPSSLIMGMARLSMKE